MSDPSTSSGPVLVVMRLADMHRTHPKQDNGHACSKCGETVGIYPSGQHVLKHNPRVAIVCSVCALLDARLDDFNQPAAPFPDILQEIAESSPSGLYRDARFPERTCDCCGLPYRGPAVYCSLECALADA